MNPPEPVRDAAADAVYGAPRFDWAEVAAEEAERLELSALFDEDFELVCTLPGGAVEPVREALSVPLARVGTVTESGLTLDGEPLPDRGYTH